MMHSDDVFTIHKDVVFRNLFTSPVKNGPSSSPSTIACLDLPTSPMSSSETYLALKDRYQMSLLRMKDKRRDGTKAKTLMRRQSRASISMMLDNVNTIAATPLKFLSEANDNVLLTVRKSTMKRNSLYTKKTSPKITRHKYYNKKPIKEIFSAQFADNNLYTRGLTEPTPPSSLLKSAGVKLHPVADADLWLRLFPSSEDFSAVCEAVIAATEELEDLPTVTTTTTTTEVVEESPEEHPVVYSPVKTPIETPAPTAEQTLNPNDQYAAMFPDDDVINARLAKDRRRASTMNYKGRSNYSSKDFDFENPMSATKPPKTPTKVVQDVIQFSARKMAALVKSMKKHDQSIRKSLVRAPSAVEATTQQQQEASGEKTTSASATAEPSPESHEYHTEWEVEESVESSVLTYSPVSRGDDVITPSQRRSSRTSSRKSRVSLGLVPLGELHSRRQTTTATTAATTASAAAEDEGSIAVVSRLARTPTAPSAASAAAPHTVDTAVSGVTASGGARRATLQDIKSPEYFFNMTSPMLSPLPASAASAVKAPTAAAAPRTPVAPKTATATVPTTAAAAAPSAAATPAFATPSAPTPAGFGRSQVVFRTPQQHNNGAFHTDLSSAPDTPMTGVSTVPATPVGRLATPAPFKGGGKAMTSSMAVSAAVAVGCSLDSAMKFKLPDSVFKTRSNAAPADEEPDENMSEDQLNQSYFTDVPSPIPQTNTTTAAVSTPVKSSTASAAVTPLTVTPAARTPYSAFKNREGYVSTGKKRYDNKIRELFQSCDNVLSQISEFF